jgi:hypothetical protein
VTDDALMSAPGLTLTANDESLHANGDHEKETIATDSPIEMSEEENEPESPIHRGASSVEDDHDSVHDSVGAEGHSDEDSGEEDDDEPALKYGRIGGALPDLLKKDSACALAISNNILVSTSRNHVELLLFIQRFHSRLLERIAESYTSWISRANESNPTNPIKLPSAMSPWTVLQTLS